MAKIKSAIDIIDESEEKRKSGNNEACPVCGAPNGRLECEKCGWGVEELGADYSVSSGDPVQVLSNAHRTFRAVKEELKDLKKQNAALILNNQKFSELVEGMEKQNKTLRADAGKKYVYSYGTSGWGQIGDLDVNNLHIKRKTASVDDINKQLGEITKLLKHYKK